MKLVKITSIVLTMFCAMASGQLLAQTQGISLGMRAADVKAQLTEPFEELGSVLRFGTCEGSEGGKKWALVFLPDLPGAGGQETARGGKLTAVQRFACGAEQLDDAAVAKEAAKVMPGDAKYVREFQTEDGRLARVFHSPSLARVCSVADLVTCDAESRVQPESPGTFSYTRAADGKSWFIGLGTCL